MRRNTQSQLCFTQLLSFSIFNPRFALLISIRLLLPPRVHRYVKKVTIPCKADSCTQPLTEYNPSKPSTNSEQATKHLHILKYPNNKEGWLCGQGKAFGMHLSGALTEILDWLPVLFACCAAPQQSRHETRGAGRGSATHISSIPFPSKDAGPRIP